MPDQRLPLDSCAVFLERVVAKQALLDDEVDVKVYDHGKVLKKFSEPASQIPILA
jgi:hypothetical protein